MFTLINLVGTTPPNPPLRETAHNKWCTYQDSSGAGGVVVGREPAAVPASSTGSRAVLIDEHRARGKAPGPRSCTSGQGEILTKLFPLKVAKKIFLEAKQVEFHCSQLN